MIDTACCPSSCLQDENELFSTYVDALMASRKKKGLSRDVAIDTVRGDVNMFGVLMVHCGDADGMVSGAIHTTAATVRPAMQVLRNEALRVSSVFFMCLPGEVGSDGGQAAALASLCVIKMLPAARPPLGQCCQYQAYLLWHVLPSMLQIACWCTETALST